VGGVAEWSVIWRGAMGARDCLRKACQPGVTVADKWPGRWGPSGGHGGRAEELGAYGASGSSGMSS
jgi:hypothetical protein